MKLLHLSLIFSLFITPVCAMDNRKKTILKSPTTPKTSKKVTFAPDVIDNEKVKDSAELVQQHSVPKECVKGISWGTAALILACIGTELGLTALDNWSSAFHRFAPVRNQYSTSALLRTIGCIAFSSATAYAVYQSVQAFKKMSKKQLRKNS